MRFGSEENGDASLQADCEGRERGEGGGKERGRRGERKNREMRDELERIDR